MQTTELNVRAEPGAVFSVRGLMMRWDLRRRHRRLEEHAKLDRGSFAEVFLRTPLAMLVVRGHELVIEASSDAAEGLIAGGHAVGRALCEVMPEIAEQGRLTLLHDAMAGLPVERRDGVVCRFEQKGHAGGAAARSWDVRCSRLDDAGGGKERMIVVLADVTAEVARQHALEQRAAEADTSSRARDEFLAMLTHELRSPLSPIVSSLERIRHKGAAMREHGVIERQVRHLQRLVEDLLDVARITRGGLELRKRRIELAEIVSASVERLQPLLEEREQRLALDVPSGLAVEVDPDRMSQVVCNLLGNAAKFSAKRSAIAICARPARGWVRLTVADQGVGIESEDIEQIFDAFRGRSGNCRSREGAGLGLGLTIVRDLVRQHGGEVYARSAGPGQGSEFAVDLPWHARRGTSEASAPTGAAQ